MNRFAVVFPGQGSQRVGMGRALHAEPSGAIAALFERADAVLGMPLSRLCLEGPEEELNRTENTQPALFLVGMAAWEALRRELPEPPVAMAGHSLGEYTALCAAGALSFEDGLRLVRRRGELMAGIAARVPGGMAAILGLPGQAEAICRAAAGGQVLEVANFNSPDQIVLSGETEAIERAIALARERGGRGVRLRVSAPFHSSLMAPIAEEMAAALAAVPIAPPRVPVIANVTAEPVSAPEEIRQALVRQLAGSVRWVETVERLRQLEVAALVECGPGRVLTGLAARWDPPLLAYAVDDPDSARAAAAALRAAN